MIVVSIVIFVTIIKLSVIMCTLKSSVTIIKLVVIENYLLFVRFVLLGEATRVG